MAVQAVGDPTRRALLDAVERDANGERDASSHLAHDPVSWRIALIEIMDDIRARITAINADLKANHPRTYKAHQLQQERAALVDRQASCESRLRHVKQPVAEQVRTEPRLTSSKSPTLARPVIEPGTPIEMARAHLYAALDILRDLEASGTPEVSV